MNIPDFLKSYKNNTADLLRIHEETKAMSLAVGGDFEAVGLLEYFLLLQNGLQRNHTVIDVGCGSGRLAFYLREYLDGLYVGIDIIPELLQYAKKYRIDLIGNFMKFQGYQSQNQTTQQILYAFSRFLHIFYMKKHLYILRMLEE